jgi:crotonobetainyl-CoA:carnitine CoA-transferase CaiB-like acyl-CoA transferase
MTPLSSLKILDFSGLLPGPYASMMLADLGAEVLRVESPTRPDLVRSIHPFDQNGESAAHGFLNRSKRAIALDLKKPEATGIIKRLVAKYDIVLEQFRPGVMGRLGLGYEDLREANPRLIYCALTGYGQTGPFRDRAGHDMNYVATSGIASYSAREDGRPLPLGVQLADLAGGSLHAVIGILAAAIHRDATGEGQFIDVSMTDAAFALNAIYGPAYLVGGVEPEPGRMMLNGGGFYDYYETRDGRYFSVGSLEPQFREQLCEAIGRPELFELSASASHADERQFKEALAVAFRERTYAEWRDVFAAADACVEPVLKFSEAVEHPQIQARGMVLGVPRADGSLQRQIASPIKFSACEPQYRHVGVALGADTLAVLREIGLSTAQIDELEGKGVFGEIFRSETLDTATIV